MLDVKLLGQFEILIGGLQFTIPTRNAQSLFAYLILNAGQAQRREKLSGLLWPGSSEENARSNLRHELWRLRKSLDSNGESYFLVDDITITFNPQIEYRLDTQLLENARLENSTAETLIKALAVYRGELLPGFYDEWISAERTRLAAAFEARITRLLEILLAEGRWDETVEWGQNWISLGQWPETAYRALIIAHANLGDLSKAGASYERFAKGLQKDLGLKPSEQTQALYKRLKAGWKPETISPKVQGSLSANPSANIIRPGFPLLKVSRARLPDPLTSFVGREKEIQGIHRLIPLSRLVTITGSGGVGKTRLAIQVAGDLGSRFKDGTIWIELASLPRKFQPLTPNPNAESGFPQPSPTPEHLGEANPVIRAVAQALQIPELPGKSLLEGVLEHLQSQQILLVLDNCEHLIEACATLVEQLLANCPALTILATSQEALGVRGEKAWLLPPLSLPVDGSLPSTPEEYFRFEAVSLFVQRAAQVLPSYSPTLEEASTIAQICLRLDGIPLAIELAAARLNLLSAQEILARLDRRFSLLTSGHRTAIPRHQTLLAAIEWSYDLLSPAERVLFQRLSVFSGSFSLEAAEAICTGPEITEDDVITVLGRLVAKSFLTVESAPPGSDLPTRYRLPDTIARFGMRKLTEAGEIRRMREQHVAYYVRLVEMAEPELLLHNQVRWFKLLQTEQDNLRAGIDWSVENDQAENGLRLVSALLWYWFSYGSTREGRDLFLRTLACPSANQFPERQARALNSVGFLMYLLGDLNMARRSLEEALTIYRAAGAEAGMAWSMQFLGLVLANEKEYDQADTIFQEGLALTRKLDGQQANNLIHLLGDIYVQKGETGRAKTIYQESINVLRAKGSQSFLAYPLRRLGYLALRENELLMAKDYFLESLEINQGIGDKRAVAACLVSLAALALKLEKPVTAARLYGAVESHLESLAIKLMNMDQNELGLVVSQLYTFLDQTTLATIFNAGWKMTDDLVQDQVKEISNAIGPA
jgi:predicted ATPase/DNA-binding SARP family transcriptional activator